MASVSQDSGSDDKRAARKPPTRVFSLGLRVTLLERTEVAANKRNAPYPSLIRMWLPEKAEEIGRGYG